MKIKHIVLIILLSLILIIFCGVKINRAYNEGPTIIYDGQKKEITYHNINDKEIFTDLTELMPGDVRQRVVTLKAENIKNKTKLFLKMNHDIDENVLKYIKVYADNKELKNHEEFIEIGDFTDDNEIQLKIVVDIPKEVGNEIESLNYSVEWNILVQEEDGKLVNVPNTFDDNNIVLYVFIMIIAMIILVYSIRKIVILVKE